MTELNASKPNCPRWAKLLLAASLSVNLLIVGLAVGAMLNFSKKGGPPRLAETGGAYTAALNPKDRRTIGMELAEIYRTGPSSRQDVQQQYQRMIAVLKTEPFDRAAAEAVLERQSQFAQERRMAGERALLNRLEAMTPAERAAFLERLENRIKRAGSSSRP